MYSAGDLQSVRDGSGQWMIRDGGKNTAGGIMRMIQDGGGKKRAIHTRDNPATRVSNGCAEV